MKPSEAQLCGKNVHRCGYCHSSDGSVSYGFLSNSLRINDYDALLQRGWRRSGTYFYKPLMHITCCPAYTIRLPVSDFLPSKSQRKILRKLETMGSLEIRTEPASSSDEKLALYREYQHMVHGDDPNAITATRFIEFLVASPLQNEDPNDDYGTLHQCYYLGGRLVAVGVLDVLPSGLSSVYCFYDPHLRSLALGKISALREIEYARQRGLTYYYLGFYIHSCPKMRYKAEYQPSQLLCPITLTWQPLDACVVILDSFRFSPLAPDVAAARATLGADASTEALEQFDLALPAEDEVTQLRFCLPRYRGMYGLQDLTDEGRATLAPILRQWLQLAGKEIAQRFIISI